MDTAEIKKILEEQLQLLSELSKSGNLSGRDRIDLAKAMASLASFLMAASAME